MVKVNVARWHFIFMNTISQKLSSTLPQTFFSAFFVLSFLILVKSVQESLLINKDHQETQRRKDYTCKYLINQELNKISSGRQQKFFPSCTSWSHSASWWLKRCGVLCNLNIFTPQAGVLKILAFQNGIKTCGTVVHWCLSSLKGPVHPFNHFTCSARWV